MKSVSQAQLLAFADRYEPSFTQTLRMATCASCERRMILMHHCWLTDGRWYKEIHLCRRCWGRYAK
jgi:hypothetical protein